MQRRLLPVVVALAFVLVALAAACGSSDNGASPTPTAFAAVAATATRSPAASAATVSRTPSPTPFPTPAPDAPLYIALGDSLSAGNGASDRNATAFVPLVRAGLGAGIALLNLGKPGDTSDDLLRGGRLERAAGEVGRRRDDNVPGNEVRVVTLEIGGNDLLNLYSAYVLTGACPSVTESLQRPQCVQALRDALSRFGPNLHEAITRLQAAGPDVPIFLMTLYNPFSGGSSILDQLGELSLEGQPDSAFPEGLNDIIRQEATATGVHLVDAYPLFKGKAFQYIAQDLIHPNDAGYRVMADAVLAAMSQAGVARAG
jgi:lysophospholipase L1-like esterase